MRELDFILKNSSWVNLINFTKEGIKNYKYVIAILLFFEQGSILCRAICGVNHIVNYREMSLERGNSDT